MKTSPLPNTREMLESEVNSAWKSAHSVQHQDKNLLLESQLLEAGSFYGFKQIAMSKSQQQLQKCFFGTTGDSSHPPPRLLS